MSEKLQETIATLITIVVALAFAVGIVWGVIYLSYDRPKQQCESLSVDLNLPTRWDNVCLAKVNGVWTPIDQLAYLVSDLLKDQP